MALVLNERLSNILRVQARVKLGQISPQLAASQLGMTAGELQNFEIGQGDSSLGPGDRGVGESLQDFETRRFGQQRFSSQIHTNPDGSIGRGPCGRPGQPPCFGTGQLEDNQLATVFDEVPDEVPSPFLPGGFDPLTFQPQDSVQGSAFIPQLPLPSLSPGPRGFIPSPSRPDAGVGRRRLVGQLVRPPGGGIGGSARGGGRRPGSTLQPRRQAPGDLVKKRLLNELVR